jgi:hypothetical protein
VTDKIVNAKHSGIEIIGLGDEQADEQTTFNPALNLEALEVPPPDPGNARAA